MSSIRLFILGSLAERGEMHGHALRLLAEEEHTDNWTDFGPGAIYGAIKRLAADGLVEVRRTEREGNYPERHVYGITPAGSEVLGALRRETLETIVYRHDPFDLALARLDVAGLDALEGILRTRLAELRASQEQWVERAGRIREHLTLTEAHVMRHHYHRFAGEIAWHEELIGHLPAIIEDEKKRKGQHE